MTLDISGEHPQTQLPVNVSPITEDEVKRAIKQLKNNKAAGQDDITGELLKKGGGHHCPVDDRVIQRNMGKTISPGRLDKRHNHTHPEEREPG